MQDRISYAKERSGYGAEDIPCAPRRSAYTDDAQGTGAFRLAQEKWELYVMLLHD